MYTVDRETYKESSYQCEKAIDSTVCDKDNGLLWQENTLLSASFELEAPETFDTIIIINGVGKPEQKINGIKIQTKTSKTNSYWQNVFKEVRVKNYSGALETDGSLILKKGQEFLQITFNPVQE